MDKLEAVQKFALKLVSHLWDTSYEELLRLVDVPMLGERRLHLKLAHVYKIVHGLCYFPEDVFQTYTATHKTRISGNNIL